MPSFPLSPRPDQSPWGAVQQANQIAPGIWSVTTASHGGLLLSEARSAAMPDALRLPGDAYEEDCDWSLVYLAFESELALQKTSTAGFLQLAKDTARCWHPDRYAAHTGECVEPNRSSVLRTREAYRAAIGEFCTTTAWGDWADWVPEGKVGVIARKVISVNHLGRPTYADEEICALVDKDAYRERGEVTVLSAIPHTIIDPPESIRPKRIA